LLVFNWTISRYWIIYKRINGFYIISWRNDMSKMQSITRIYTSGSLRIQRGNDVIPLKGEKSRSLLAYLILHPRIAHRRELISDMLWQDAPPERVRQNLSDLLYRLQKESNIDWLLIETDTLAIQPNENLWVDVWEFDHLISSTTIEELRKAVELYNGELLPEIYEDWVIAERELRRSQYISALETLSKLYETEGKLQDALLIARKLILTEPLHEPAHQTYLRLLGRLKRFGEALAHYDYFCSLLRSELDSKPIAETESILNALVRERDLEGAPLIIEEIHPFVGRKAERAAALAVVEEMLNGNGSILMVEGEEGMGKSRFVSEGKRDTKRISIPTANRSIDALIHKPAREKTRSLIFQRCTCRTFSAQLSMG
jgi:DNA-binding SARP family transcriptional activator